MSPSGVRKRAERGQSDDEDSSSGDGSAGGGRGSARRSSRARAGASWQRGQDGHAQMSDDDESEEEWVKPPSESRQLREREAAIKAAADAGRSPPPLVARTQRRHRQPVKGVEVVLSGERVVPGKDLDIVEDGDDASIFPVADAEANLDEEVDEEEVEWDVKEINSSSWNRVEQRMEWEAVFAAEEFSSEEFNEMLPFEAFARDETTGRVTVIDEFEEGVDVAAEENGQFFRAFQTGMGHVVRRLVSTMRDMTCAMPKGRRRPAAASLKPVKSNGSKGDGAAVEFGTSDGSYKNQSRTAVVPMNKLEFEALIAAASCFIRKKNDTSFSFCCLSDFLPMVRPPTTAATVTAASPPPPPSPPPRRRRHHHHTHLHHHHHMRH